MAINTKDFPNIIEKNLWANNGFDVFFYNFVYNKKRYRGIIDYKNNNIQTKRDKISNAKQEVAKIKTSLQDKILDSKITMDEFITMYFNTLPDTNWKKTLRSHYNRYILPLVGAKAVVSIRQIHIQNIIKEQENKNLKPRTIKQTLEILQPLFKSAIANRLLVFNPCDGIKIKRAKTKKIVVNASEQLSFIYNAIHLEFKNEPYYLAMYLLFLQGRRKSEVLKLRWEDVDLKNNYYILRETKSGETQRLFFTRRSKIFIRISKR